MRHLNGIPCRIFYFVPFFLYLKNKDNRFISLQFDTLKVTPPPKKNAANLFSIVRIVVRS